MTSTNSVNTAFWSAQAAPDARPDAAISEYLIKPGSATGQLSFAQERLWLLEQLEESSNVHNVSLASRLRGPLDVEAVQHGLNRLVVRHAALRTTFRTCDGHPIQVVADSQCVVLSIVDLSQYPDAGREAELERVLTTESRLPFDPTRGPLLRAMLVRLADADHALLLTLHGLVGDAWSLGVLSREMSELYAAYLHGRAATLPELWVQYVDFAAWQRNRIAGAELERLLGYWRSQLGGAPAILELPGDRPQPTVGGGRVESVQFQLPPLLVSALKDVSEAHDATLSMTLLACFGALLGRYTHQEIVLVGSPVTGRPRPALDGIVGLFANTLALRIDLSGDPSFSELLRRVREMVLGAERHQDLPFEKLVDHVQPQPNRASHPLVQVMFELHTLPRPALQQAGLTSTPIDRQTGSLAADLSLTLVDTGAGLEGRLDYAADRFDRAMAERFIPHYELLLDGIVGNPQRAISQFPLLGASERQQVLLDWNDTAAEYPREVCLHQLVELQVDRTPDATAVVADDRTLSYGALDTLANQLAHYLAELGVGRGDLVALSLDRTTDMLVALLAIGKAGAGYVPIDPAYPVERRAFILADSGARMLMTQRQLLVDAPATSLPVVCVDAPTVQAAIAAQSKTRPAVVATSEDVAYVIYTSGSTGRPKGVRLPHRAVVNLLVSARQTPGIDADDVVLAITTLSFDIAVYDLWAALSVGARIALASSEAAANGTLLLDLLRSSGATVLQATPATWRSLIEAGWQGGSGLKVISTGEALPRDLAEQLASRADDVWNMYGPTETTVWSAYWRVPRQPGPVVIGRPMANTRLYVLDASGQLVPVGVSGELYIGGDGVADGYLGLPDQTAQRFLPDPFVPGVDSRMYRTGDLARWRSDGQLEYLGRNDQQVKLRGHRIELGEIEALLREHPLVRDAAVIVREDTPGDQLLVAYIVGTDGGSSAQPADLRAFLRRRVTEPMVPAAFVALAALPLTANGKLDRKALPRPELTNTYAAPTTELEARLAGLWAELMGVERVGIHDDFFELGGHSLLAVRLFTRLKTTLEVDLSLDTLVRAPTIALFAQLIAAESAKTAWTPLVPFQTGGSGTPFFCVHGAGGNVLNLSKLARRLGNQRPFYGLQAQGVDGVLPPLDRIEDMAALYVSAIRDIQPHGPYLLGGYSGGGVVAFEMAQQLALLGERTALLVLLDTFSPLVLDRRYTWRERVHDVVFGGATYYADKVKAIRAARAFKHTLRQADNYSARGLVVPVELRDAQMTSRYVRIQERYRPQVYAGRLTLFRAANPAPIYAHAGPNLGWSDLAAGGVEVHEISGDHDNLILEPHVDELTASLQECLSRAEAQARPD